jgi:RNA polymerase sigma-70 factor (ECF subfamily)
MKDKEKIFFDVINSNQNRIYRIIWTFTSSKSDAEDLYQGVLLKVWSNIEKFKHKSKASTWLYRVVMNTCIDYTRREKKGFTLLRNQLESLNIDGEIDIELEYIESEKLSILHRCIQSLSVTDKLLITLFLEDLKYSEIGKIVGISERNVAVKLSRIKKKITKMIGEDGNT